MCHIVILCNGSSYPGLSKRKVTCFKNVIASLGQTESFLHYSTENMLGGNKAGTAAPVFFCGPKFHVMDGLDRGSDVFPLNS